MQAHAARTLAGSRLACGQQRRSCTTCGQQRRSCAPRQPTRRAVATRISPPVTPDASTSTSHASPPVPLPSPGRAQAPGGGASLARKKTKVVATIGPTSNTRDTLFALADAGMNVVRLNMSHGDHASHMAIVDLVREYNASGKGSLAIMLDTKGPEVRSGDLKQPLELLPGARLVFTITEGADGSPGADGVPRVTVNYDGFVEDVSPGDILLVDGGIMALVVLSVQGADVECEVVDGGAMGSRRHLNVRGKSANLPAITERDWADIAFGIQADVDFFALSFVRDAKCILELKDYLKAEGRTGTRSIGVLAKIESADAVTRLDEILDVSDGAMVARGDLGAELPVEDVPFWQSTIVDGCRKRGKPVIVATNMLESMVTLPTPTRAEVTDISVAVKEGADAVMLSGETAYGAYPLKALEVMATVARRTEQGLGGDPSTALQWPGTAAMELQRDEALSRQLAYHAVRMAGSMQGPLVVFSHRGKMPAFLSHYRPSHEVFCFTDSEQVQRRMGLYHGVTALHMEFADSAEVTFDLAVAELKVRGLVQAGQLLCLVQSSVKPIWKSTSMHSITIRQVPE